MDLLGLFYDFSQVSSFVRSTAVCSATFRRDLLLQLLNPRHTISAVTALQAAAQLEVACTIFCVLRLSCVMNINLSIDLSVHLSPGLLAAAAAGFVWYTAAILLAATSIPNVYWLEWARPPNALACGRPPRAPSPLSPTSSPSFSVRLIDCVHFLVRACMHAPPPPACLLSLLLTTATFSPSRHHHQTWRWHAWSSYATAASRRQARGAYVTLQAPFITFSLTSP